MSAVLASLVIGVYALRWPIAFLILTCWTVTRVCAYLDRVDQRHNTPDQQQEKSSR